MSSPVTMGGDLGTPGIEIPGRVRELALRLGRDDAALPAYLYDLDGLAAHVAGIRAAIPSGIEVFYAVKANPDPAVLRIVARQVDGLEVSSGGELRHAAEAAPACRLAFGGPGKTTAELASAIRAGTFRFHVESPQELYLLSSAAQAVGRPADILLRVNIPADAIQGLVLPDAGRGLVMGGRPAPFGMDPVLLDHCAEWLSAGGSGHVRLRGLHAHLASGLDAAALLGTAARVLGFGREWCARHGVRRPEFNLGGGMAVDYRKPGSVFDWARYGRGLARARTGHPGETLRIEPGRAVTVYCGWYVTRVLDVKRSYGEAFAVVAGGTHHLRTPAAKGHDQPFAVIPVDAWPHDWARSGVAAEPVTIVGQLCTPKDVLARHVTVARLRAHDLVAFGLAGAYAWNISHHGFLMHPQPGFHYVGAG